MLQDPCCLAALLHSRLTQDQHSVRLSVLLSDQKTGWEGCCSFLQAFPSHAASIFPPKSLSYKCLCRVPALRYTSKRQKPTYNVVIVNFSSMCLWTCLARVSMSWNANKFTHTHTHRHSSNNVWVASNAQWCIGESEDQRNEMSEKVIHVPNFDWRQQQK